MRRSALFINYFSATHASCEGKAHGGILDLWLSHIKNVYEKYSLELDDIEDIEVRANRLSELNVVE
jgi:hypothetical protein